MAIPCAQTVKNRFSPGRLKGAMSFSSKQAEMFRQISQETRRVVASKKGSSSSFVSVGVLALFSGRSGTGKTLAAEMIARDLGASLFRVSLKQVMSKYIGETEKNLVRVFEEAEKQGAVLLFDEADALFGKRAEVKDSHDRYANQEVSYLLKKIESHRGLVILSFNHSIQIDPIIACRVKYLLEFSPPVPSPLVQPRR